MGCYEEETLIDADCSQIAGQTFLGSCKWCSLPATLHVIPMCGHGNHFCFFSPLLKTWRLLGAPVNCCGMSVEVLRCIGALSGSFLAGSMRPSSLGTFHSSRRSPAPSGSGPSSGDNCMW